MKIRALYTLLALVLVVGLAGCKAGSMTQSTVELPPVKSIQESDLSDDQLLALAAVVNRMRGRPNLENAVFDPDQDMMISESGFSYDNMELTNTILLGAESVKLADGKFSSVLEGLFLFRDDLGRRAGARFAVKYYTLPAKGILISDARVSPEGIAYPKVEVYTVLQSAIDITTVKFDNYETLYRTVVEKSFPMTFTSADERQYGDKDKYLVFVFCKDRVSPMADFKIEGTPKIKPLYANINGWPVGVFGAKFKPGSPMSKFKFTVTYNPAPDSGGSTVVVGRFENKLYQQEEKTASN
ncbi:hypothetical protein [uncultured Pseudodesulfovibrio sp.]|uniref:hypothetical protein n=1 Tax=uncultured Pseudodesulfovibrio sp. TaxID=2035858 RepID=UPI0029C72825|nr:hypothetical protein [uncultured Pseudodesulfovibrio sp.]